MNHHNQQPRKGVKWPFVVGFIILLIGSLVLYAEISGARGFCKSVQGKPSLTGKTCNGEPLMKYSDGWSFDRGEQSLPKNFTLNFSQIP